MIWKHPRSVFFLVLTAVALLALLARPSKAPPVLPLSTAPSDLPPDSRINQAESDPLVGIDSFGPSTKFLLFQPSGGWNNQLYCMQKAMQLAVIYNRVLLLPPAGSHTNLAHYAELDDSHLWPIGMAVDVTTLSRKGKVHRLPGALPLNTSLLDTVNTLRTKFGEKSIEEVHTTLNGKSNRAALAKRVNGRGGKPIPNSSRFLFFSGVGLFNFGLPSFPRSGSTIRRYSSQLRSLAFKLAQPLGVYSALHVRLSDMHKVKANDRLSAASVDSIWQRWVISPPTKKGAFLFTSFQDRQVKTSWREDISAPFPSGIRTLYVATEPSSPPGFFSNLCSKDRFRCIFARDLDQDIVQKFRSMLSEKAPGLIDDMFGLVEQLLCANAMLFSGTMPKSTFTRQIIQIRDNLVFSFPESTENGAVALLRGNGSRSFALP